MVGARCSNVRVFCENEKVKFNEIGEVLFKENGVSGIVIFNLSAHFARNNIKNAEFFIDFLPNINENDLFFKFKERKNTLSNYKIKDFLTGLFMPCLCEKFLSTCKLNYESDVKTLSDEKLNQLIHLIKNYKIEMKGYENNYQVKTGGISLNSLLDNLESKTNKNLFFIGEAVNIDGVCGGYNLQWAFTSAAIVVRSL